MAVVELILVLVLRFAMFVTDLIVKLRSILISATVLIVVMLTGCSEAAREASTASTTTPTYSIQVNVRGLLGSGLVLKNNGGDDLHIAADGEYRFPATLLSGSKYLVTIATQPLRPR